jgi:beta-N-acetylhexosaminidase
VAGLDPSAAAITVTEPVNPGALMADRHGRPTVLVVRGLAVDPWQRAFVEAAAGSDPLVLVELGWPAADPPPVDLYVVTHGASAASCRAVADLLFAPAPAGAPHG